MVRIRVMAALLAAGAAVPVLAHQERPAPVVLGTVRPLTSAEAASRLTGSWKLNEDVSPAPVSGAPPSTVGRPGGRGGGVPGRATQLEQDGLRLRAIYRELTARPQALTLTVSDASALFVDEDGLERRVTLNSKKDKLDIGTLLVDSRAYWNGSALTIELDAGPQLKLTETFELSPTGRQMLVTLKTDGFENETPGRLRGRVQRVYDRVG
ncbi:MAG: hypothetical protein WCQ64_05890 [Acidobacteriota bacterium]